MDLDEAINSNLHFILVGCDTAKERDAMSEFWHVLIKYCKINPIEVFELTIRGLFLVAIEVDIKTLNTKLKSVIENQTYKFLYCRKSTPLEVIVESSLEEIIEKSSKLMKKVPNKESWRVSVNRRHTKIKRKEIINAVTSQPSTPKGRVDLTDPSWEIIIEIFGKWTGIAILPSGYILSLEDE